MKTSTNSHRFLFCGLFILGTASFCSAQNIYTIGTGTNYNSSYSYPAPYGNYYYSARHQILIRASELTAVGASAGYIISLGFNVYMPNGSALQSFTIKMRNTTNTTVTSTFTSSGFTTVWGPQTFTETYGWNTHTFSNSFYWDGTSNVLMDICFNNTNSSYNARMYYTSSAYTSVGYYSSYSSTCLATSGTTSYSRPNMQIGMPANAPPVPDFTSDVTTTCNGTVGFSDISSNVPTSWLWNFGDGGTSILKNPSHTYTTDGNYNVKLKVCNSFGCDSTTKYNYISVSNIGTGPGNPSCTPGTQNLTNYYGLFNVNFGSINNTTTSGDGYHDYTCDFSTTVIEGMSYPISVQTGYYSDEDVRVWIDYNNNGSFTSSELVFSSDNKVQFHSGNILIPSSAVKNLPLRMRVLGDDSYSTYAPCTLAYYGQYEDYTLVVTPNTYPPDAKFTVNKIVSCSGSISFYDSSSFVPTSWLWDFGDGSNSTMQNPTHFYSNTGTYTVKLVVCNSFGCDSITKTDYVDIRGGGEPVSTCTPTQSTPMSGYGIYFVKFNSIDISSNDALEGNKSFTCEGRTYVVKGQSYPISVNTGSSYMQDVRVWIDWDNNGNFAYTELAFSSDNITGTHSGNIAVPSSATANVPLRMRVLGDYYISSACSAAYYGQFEDYAVVVIPDNIAPIGDFDYEALEACQGIFKFTDQSMPNPTTWKWDFGDGTGISFLPDPYYVYNEPGTFTVTMIVGNAYGTDTVRQTITVNRPFADFSYTQSDYTFTFTDLSLGATSWYWDFGDGYSATLQNPAHVYMAAGSYTVKLIIYNSSGCMTQTTKVVVITSGIAGIESGLKLKIYPNPANERIYIDYPVAALHNLSITIRDINGKTVYSAKPGTDGTIRSIDLSGMSNGIYFLKVQADEDIWVEKVGVCR